CRRTRLLLDRKVARRQESPPSTHVPSPPFCARNLRKKSRPGKAALANASFMPRHATAVASEKIAETTQQPSTAAHDGRPVHVPDDGQVLIAGAALEAVCPSA